ncbi:uncharacterized protein LOC131663079 [Phymastichus coffea]|uniref:uncharacterized protein LOC131663079 n=1 Tax=Phymastichus coffea TaxID=108790 RepID=UPI00273AD5B4|nr:uncharacterized protein LOC131663079 [Phymastichus coffea]
MKSLLVVALLISTCLAEKKESAQPRLARAPQGHIQYSDPDGLKVSWKLYSPHSQWRSHLEEAQRNERAESGTTQPSFGSYQGELIRPAANAAAPAIASEKSAQSIQPVQVQYKPHSMVPSHIKQLIHEMYEPQAPYIDPAVFIYRPHRQLEEARQRQQASSEQDKSFEQVTSLGQHDDGLSSFEHIPKFQSEFSFDKPKLELAQYADDQSGLFATTATPLYGTVPQREPFSGEEQEFSQEKQHQQAQTPRQNDNMPKEIHELLNLQAQIPYHVIANKIVYKPKSMFIPKAFKEDAKTPYKYRTKVYYIKNDEAEEQKSKERKEREEPKDSFEFSREQQQQEE